MLRLSKKSEYGLLLLGELASGAAGPRSARELAARLALSRPLVANLLKRLTRGGLLAATRGAGGGYALRRPAAAVSLRDVVVATDGPLSLTACAGKARSRSPCGRSGCRARPVLYNLQRSLDRLLAGVTLAALVGPPRPLSPGARRR